MKPWKDSACRARVSLFGAYTVYCGFSIPIIPGIMAFIFQCFCPRGSWFPFFPSNHPNWTNCWEIYLIQSIYCIRLPECASISSSDKDRFSFSLRPLPWQWFFLMGSYALSRNLWSGSRNKKLSTVENHYVNIARAAFNKAVAFALLKQKGFRYQGAFGFYEPAGS